jgi:hypothetical protein
MGRHCPPETPHVIRFSFSLAVWSTAYASRIRALSPVLLYPISGATQVHAALVVTKEPERRGGILLVVVGAFLEQLGKVGIVTGEVRKG